MTGPPPQTVCDIRRATRFSIDFETICEYHPHQEIRVRIANISANGMMLAASIDREKGDRVIVHLPVAGRIEAHLAWSHQGRQGFTFERVIREPDFYAMLDKINGI
ncbi:PilZ domain-containing protein [Sphingorhabdus sp. M41]|uniref:PilZ domain-containing protein n=1 Tax=Sphingorhabdus sp. M41 TaxID=1806885 RepID=UPI0009EEE559|nr:PilZ domain-containing protein [Sphingorhabdus sp. M41]